LSWPDWLGYDEVKAPVKPFLEFEDGAGQWG
jgi:hypothetical protein